MKINVLRKMRYQNTFIYILQMEYTFMYLFSLVGEIYQNHIILKPNLFNRIKYRLFGKTPYSRTELEEGEKMILSGAMDSLDKAIAEGVTTRQAQRQKQRAMEKVDDGIRARSKEPCMWQAIDSNEGFYYQCLTHGMAVKMKDGEKPVHDVLSPIQAETI